MKQILLFIALLCIGFACNAQVLSDLTLEGLKGAVQVCETTTYTATDQFGEINYGEVIGVTVEEYDTKGFCTTYIYIDKDGRTEYTYVNQYTPSGKIELIDQYDKKGNLVVRNKFTYSVGKAVNTVYGNVSKGSTDLQGEIIWTKGKMVDNTSLFHSIYYYDAYNRLIKKTQKDLSGGDIIITYNYNKKGTLFSVSYSSHMSFLNTYYSHYEYDEKDNWILRIKRDYKGNAKEIQVRKIVYRP